MSEINAFSGKVGLQQRVLPDYRAPFFELLAASCRGGLSVFAGQPRPDEAIHSIGGLNKPSFVPAKNLHLLRGQYYLCLQDGLNNWLEGWDPDVLILEANPRYLSNRRAIDWSRRQERPIIGWGLGAPPVGGWLSEFRERGRNRYLSAFDALIAYSSIGAEQYAEAGIPPERIHVAINSATESPTHFPDREPMQNRVPRILFVGRLQARKRVDLLIRACASVELTPECWIVGDGPQGPALKQLAQEIYPAARFIGMKHGQELDELFDKADLFVLPGTGGLAIQEAMAHGLPVIVAEGDGTQRDLVGENNGWLIKPGNLEDLSRALRQALSDPGGLPRRGAASFQIAHDRANIASMVNVFVEVMKLVSGERT